MSPRSCEHCPLPGKGLSLRCSGRHAAWRRRHNDWPGQGNAQQDTVLKKRNETLKNEVSLSLKPAKGARLI
ncbi:hypothetical protein METHP14_60003 [Pseudomonas sp. P14-2025]